MKASKYHEAIPKDFPVRPLRAGQKAEDRKTCGHCGLSWDDAKPTTWTPAPSARCPFEYFHLYPEAMQCVKNARAAARRRRGKGGEVVNMPKYLMIEAPDNEITIDFMGTGSRRKKDRRACSVRLTVEDGKLHVLVMGCDDRATILCDEVYDLPEEDRRR